MSHALGDGPIQQQYREKMNAVAQGELVKLSIEKAH